MGGRLTFLVALATLTAPRATAAEPHSGDGRSALPALDRVGVAQPFDRGWAFAAGTSYGFTESVLAESDAHHRIASSIAGTYRPVEWLAVGARYDARYDRHSDDPVTDTDDGWVGLPSLFGRAIVLQRPRVAIATEVAAWFPGADGISADASAFATTRAGDILLTAGLGARFDRSANTADDADLLSPSDRMALGVSDSHAALLGFGGLWSAGGTEVFGEWSWDLLLGDDAPRTRASPMRLAAGVRWSASPAVVIGGAVQASIAARPDLAAGDPLVPVEPLVQVVATVGFRIDRRAATTDGPLISDTDTGPVEPAVGTVRGRLTNRAGEPVAGYALTVAAGGRTVATVTGPDGVFEVRNVPAGTAVVSATEQPPYGAFEQTVTVGGGDAVPELSIEVERTLPAGQIRGVVRTPGGRAVRARVRIDALGVALDTDADGRFRIEVTPGRHEVEIEASGRISQRKNVRVEQDGVTILNVELFPIEQ